MKKVIAILLTVVLTATAAIGGTLAWLTDRDSDDLTYTYGNVDIELLFKNENRVENAKLLPHKLIEDHPYIKNTGNTDALVWLTVLIPEGLYVGDDPDTSVNEYQTGSPLRINATGRNEWDKSVIEKNACVIDGVIYTAVNMLRKEVLKAGESSDYFFNHITLNWNVDIDPDGDMYYVENGVATNLGWNIKEKGTPKIYYTAYAFQAEYTDWALYPDDNGNNDGVISVQEAYAAYKAQWGTNFNAETVVAVEPDVEAEPEPDAGA